MITYLPPLLTKNESTCARRDILNLSSQYNFDYYKDFGKQHMSTDTDLGYNAIMGSEILKILSDRILFKPNFSIITQLSYCFSSLLNHKRFRIVPFLPGFSHPRLNHKQLWCDRVYSELEEKRYIESCFACMRCPVKFSMQLSVLSASAYISPHTDSVVKLASIMVYLAKDDSQVCTRIGTRFWIDNDYYIGTANNGMSQESSSFIRSGSEAKYFRNTRYIDTQFGFGTTVIFFRSNTSWHSVNIPDDLRDPRVSININIVLPSRHLTLYSELLKGK